MLTSKSSEQEVKPLIHMENLCEQSDVDMETENIPLQPTRGVQFALFTDAYSFADIEIERQKRNAPTSRYLFVFFVKQ